MALKVAIVGRPNVGKSTLFNRLVGKRLALVDDRPGVTRDRRYADGNIGDMDLTVIDTAGYEDVTDESLEARMREQTEAAIDDAELILFMMDAREGVTSLDRIFAERLRKVHKPIILLANKSESRESGGGVGEARGVVEIQRHPAVQHQPEVVADLGPHVRQHLNGPHHARIAFGRAVLHRHLAADKAEVLSDVRANPGGVELDFIAHCAAEQFMNRLLPQLSNQVPQRQVNAADSVQDQSLAAVVQG
jgi:small GTP-binding protein